MRYQKAMLSVMSFLLIISAAPYGFGQGGSGRETTPPPTAKKPTPPRKTTPARTNPPKSNRTEATIVAEIAFWETIKNSTNPEDFKAYLKRYPAGEFAELANNRIKALEAAKAPATITPAPTPAPPPEIDYESDKVERDLSAPVRIDWRDKTDDTGEYNLRFSIPSGWVRSRREEGRHYLQLSFRSPDSPATNISIQVYSAGVPHTLRNQSAEVYRTADEFIYERRKLYASQQVSATLNDTKMLNHRTGRWQTFTADYLDSSVYYVLIMLDAIYPSDIWEKKYYGTGKDSYSVETLKPSAVNAVTRARHTYAIKGSGGYVIVVLYTAPIEKFDDRLLPSVLASMKMSDGKIEARPVSSDSSINLGKYSPEILIDGELKGEASFWKKYAAAPGMHRVVVRAKEHKPFEKDVMVGGWDDLVLDVKLERITSSTSGTNPE